MENSSMYIVAIYNSGKKSQEIYRLRGTSMDVVSAVNLMANEDFKRYREQETSFLECFREQESFGSYHARLRFQHFHIDYLACLEGDVKTMDC